MCYKISHAYVCSHPLAESSWVPADVHECAEAVQSGKFNSNGTIQRCGSGMGNYENAFIYRGLCGDCWSAEWLLYHGWGCCMCSEEMEEGVTTCADEECRHGVCDVCHARHDGDCPNCGTEIRQNENWCPTCSLLVVPPQPFPCNR